MTSPYDSVNSPLSFGMMTSLRLVIPPKMKKSAKTNARRSGASWCAFAAGSVGTGSEDDVAAMSNTMGACLDVSVDERSASARTWGGSDRGDDRHGVCGRRRAGALAGAAFDLALEQVDHHGQQGERREHEL